MNQSTKDQEAGERTAQNNPYQSNLSPSESLRIERSRTMRKSATLGALACSSAPLFAFGGTRAYEFLSGVRPWTDLSSQLIILGALIAMFGAVGAIMGALIRLVGFFLLPNQR